MDGKLADVSPDVRITSTFPAFRRWGEVGSSGEDRGVVEVWLPVSSVTR